MTDHSVYISELIQKYWREEPLTPDEQFALEQWKSAGPENEAVFRELSDPHWVSGELERFRGYNPEKSRERLNALLSKIADAAPERETARRNVFAPHKVSQVRRWAGYAAAALLLATLTVYLYFARNDQKPAYLEVTAGEISEPILPGGNKALLTLADGTVIELDGASQGVLARQGNANIVKLAAGQISYQVSGHSQGETIYNTITTPRGGQYQVVLPDGSRILLNAASSLRYPTVFSGKERRVEMTGEAYFEIAGNSSSPFRVRINRETEVEVIGTHFNINSYANEKSINATLLEGAIRVVKGEEKVVLKPGQQARMEGKVASGHANHSGIIVEKANIEKVMAWKDGMFDFQNATLEEVMRQLERWYDIEVAYEAGVPKIEFIGKMGRDLPLASVLRGLEISKVHFRMEGRKLLILP